MAFEHLAIDLPRTGLAIRRINGKVGVVAADLGHPTVPIAGVRLGLNVRGLKNVAARELIRILEGQPYPRNLMKGTRGLSVSYLRTAGLVEGWPPQPTADCLRGMLMDLVHDVPTPTVPYSPGSVDGRRLGDRHIESRSPVDGHYSPRAHKASDVDVGRSGGDSPKRPSPRKRDARE